MCGKYIKEFPTRFPTLKSGIKNGSWASFIRSPNATFKPLKQNLGGLRV